MWNTVAAVLMSSKPSTDQSILREVNISSWHHASLLFGPNHSFVCFLPCCIFFCNRMPLVCLRLLVKFTAPTSPTHPPTHAPTRGPKNMAGNGGIQRWRRWWQRRRDGRRCARRSGQATADGGDGEVGPSGVPHLCSGCSASGILAGDVETPVLVKAQVCNSCVR